MPGLPVHLNNGQPAKLAKPDEKTKMEYKRVDRVGDLILRELAEVLLRRVKDPRLTNITLTDVKVSPDLRRARVFYSLLGDDEKKSEVALGLERATGFVKRELGKRLHLRRIPDIEFCFDSSLEYGSHIDRLLTDLKESKS